MGLVVGLASLVTTVVILALVVFLILSYFNRYRGRPQNLPSSINNNNINDEEIDRGQMF